MADGYFDNPNEGTLLLRDSKSKLDVEGVDVFDSKTGKTRMLCASVCSISSIKCIPHYNNVSPVATTSGPLPVDQLTELMPKRGRRFVKLFAFLLSRFPSQTYVSIPCCGA